MFFESEGVRLHYELHGPEGGAPVVLVHGFASDYRLNWVGSRWQETLTAAGRRVIGLDCRGHGRSDKPHDPLAYALDVMAGDVLRLLDHLGLESVDYVGYSMGGRIGLRLLQNGVERDSRPLRRAVLAGVGWTGAFSDARTVAAALRGEPPSGPVAQRFYDFAASRPENDLAALAACILGPNPEPDPTLLARITTPVLVVVGDQDDIASEVPRLEAALPSARVVMLPGRNHMSAVPARQFKEAVLGFLA